MDLFELAGGLHQLEVSVPKSYWSQRIIEQMAYLLELSRSRDGYMDALIGEGLEMLQEAVARDQAITPETVQRVEMHLSALKDEAKSLSIICTANAHIDMNWMWGYQETVALTIDTIRTVLTLMKEYPDFVYTQSQASVYEILETYAPELIDEIRHRVKEGRWEASVAAWVESDKNMISAEAMARHLLYAKRYVSGLLEIPETELNLDWEPDTFGHGEHVPEVLAAGGVKYYYHCRGHEGANLFRWRAPSGAEVLAFREPAWYNLSIDYGMFRYVPEFCRTYGVDSILGVYGVGDHGGGPTRRDLERLNDMRTWPLFPNIVHGSARQFFQRIERYREKLPVIEQELNYVFTGCYTSEARIKRANRYGEERMYEAEVLDVMAEVWSRNHHLSTAPEMAWRKILFNQFHDILPGSGTVETREYAMGQFQSAMAFVEAAAKQSMRDIAALASNNSDALPEVGVGIYTDDSSSYNYSHTGIVGDRQYYMIFNTTPYPRNEMVELMLWDWQHMPEQIQILDFDGREVNYQVLGNGRVFWGHSFCKILFRAKVPSMGCAVYQISFKSPKRAIVSRNMEPRSDVYDDENLILENGFLRAEFVRSTMQCVSLVDKASGYEVLDKAKPACGFELVTEDPAYQMTSWRVGPIAHIAKLNEKCKVFLTNINIGTDILRQSISYRLQFEQSSLDVTVYLDQNSECLDFALKVNWYQLGNASSGIPQLRFVVPYGYLQKYFRYATVTGMTDRADTAHDVPAHGLACAVNGTAEPSLSLLSDCKYGFRGTAGCISVTLLRSSYDPDPCPDQGVHHVKLALHIGTADKSALQKLSKMVSHGLRYCVVPVEENTPLLMKHLEMLTLTGGHLEAVKKTEDGEGYLLRISNAESIEQTAQIICGHPVRKAYITDILEQSRQEVSCQDNRIQLKLGPATLTSLIIVPVKME